MNNAAKPLTAGRAGSAAILRVIDGVNDPALILTEDPDDFSKGLKILRDVSENGAFVIREGAVFKFKIDNTGKATIYGDSQVNGQLRVMNGVRLDNNTIVLANDVPLTMNGGTYYIQGSSAGFRSSVGFRAGGTNDATWRSAIEKPTDTTSAIGSMVSVTTGADAGLWVKELSGWVKK